MENIADLKVANAITWAQYDYFRKLETALETTRREFETVDEVYARTPSDREKLTSMRQVVMDAFDKTLLRLAQEYAKDVAAIKCKYTSAEELSQEEKDVTL